MRRRRVLVAVLAVVLAVVGVGVGIATSRGDGRKRLALRTPTRVVLPKHPGFPVIEPTRTNLEPVPIRAVASQGGDIGPFVLGSTVEEFGSPSQINTINWGDISCPAVTTCVLAATTAHVFVSRNPLSPGGWVEQPLSEPPTAVDCPQINLCVIGAVDGSIFVTTHPLSGGWQHVPVIDPRFAPISSLSCGGISICAVAGAPGVLVSMDPTGGRQSWKEIHLDVGGYDAVSCPTAQFCAVGGYNGAITMSTDPMVASSWTVVQIDSDIGDESSEGLYSNNIKALDCLSSSLCLAITYDGSVYLSRDPLGGSSAWVTQNIPANLARIAQGFNIVCPTETDCIAGLAYSQNISLSIPVWSGFVDFPELRSSSCPNADVCYGVIQSYTSSYEYLTVVQFLRTNTP